MKSNEYGYIGDTPTQSSSSNTGIFSNEDVYNLLGENKWALQTFTTEYLVIAGGGSGGSGFSLTAAGAGGAGGYRNSYASESSGANSSTETPLTLGFGTNYTVTVGGGGARVSNNTAGNAGSDSVFSTITSIGGGRGASGIGGGGGGSGGSGGGGTGNESKGNGTANQGKNGGNGLHGGNTDGTDKVTTFTAGTDSVSFS